MRSSRQDLDGDVAPELGVARAVDLAHAADAEQALHVINAESPANQRLLCRGLGKRFGTTGREDVVSGDGLRQQRLDFALEVRVGAAGLGEKRGAGFALARERGVIELLDVAPAIRRHGR